MILEMLDVYLMSIVGLILTQAGDFDCDKACQQRNFICDTIIKTENTNAVFGKVGLNCSSNTIESEYSQDYHPIYYPQEQACAGYINVPEDIPCTSNVTKLNSKLAVARRICNCTDLGNTLDYGVRCI